MKGIDEYGYLYPGFLFQTFLGNNSNDSYKLFIPNDIKIDASKYIIIYIFYLINYPDVHIIDENNQILNFKNETIGKNIISYSKSNLKTNDIKINITTESGLYYGILYEIKKIENSKEDIPIINGLANIFNVNTIMNDNFFLKFNNYEPRDNLFLTLNTFSNNISVNLVNDLKNNLIQMNFAHDSFNLSNNSLIIEPLINIYSFEANEINSNILINEGVQYSNRLNENLTSITYSLLREKNELKSIKGYILNFRKYSHKKVSIEINAQNDNDEDINKTIYKLSEFIFINPSKINCNTNQNQEYCELKINITLMEQISELDFSFMLINEELMESNGIYLPKNTFMTGILRPNKNDKYYGTVDSNKYELYLDFLEGEGQATMAINGEQNSLYDYSIIFIKNNILFSIII